MPVEFESSDSDMGIPMFDLKDGQIGVIIEWDNKHNYVGEIVQRVGYDIIVIGKGFVNNFVDFICSYNIDRNHCRVRILRVGEVLRIKNN